MNFVGTLVQDGWEDSGGNWADATATPGPHPESSGATPLVKVGWLFDASFSRRPVQEASTIHRWRPVPLNLTALTLTVNTRGINGYYGADNTFSFVNDASLEEFSTASSYSTLTLATLGSTTVAGTATSDWFTFEYTATQANLDTINAVSADADWNGYLGFFWTSDVPTGVGWIGQWATRLHATEDPTLLTGTHLRAKSGLAGRGRRHENVRARECQRCGTLSPEDELVEDGFRRGLLVCGDCWEPPDSRPKGHRGIPRGEF